MAAKHSAAVKRVMTEGHQAGVRMLGQILFQPLLLGRTHAAPAHSRRDAIRIQRNDVPVSKVKTVVTLLGRARLCAPIGKISGAGGEVVLMVAGSWLRTILEAAPSRSIAIAKLGCRPAFVCQVSCRKDRAGNVLNELRRGLGSRQSCARGNISGSDQHPGWCDFPFRFLVLCLYG